jgi:hypothetical protein
MKKRNSNTDIHHIIPKSRRGEGYDVDADLNKIEIKINKHRSIHSLFQNALPLEAVELVLNLCRDVLREDFRSRIIEILREDKKRIYKKEVLEQKKKTKKQIENVIEEDFEKPLEQADIKHILDYYRNNMPFSL